MPLPTHSDLLCLLTSVSVERAGWLETLLQSAPSLPTHQSAINGTS